MGPHGDPHISGYQGWSIIDPIPDHEDGVEVSGDILEGRNLVLRQEVSPNVGDAHLTSDPFGNCPLVPGEHHQVGNPEPLQGGHRLFSLGTNVVGEGDSPVVITIQADVDRGSFQQGLITLGRNILEFPNFDLVPIDGGRDSFPGCFNQVGDGLELDGLLAGEGQEGPGQNVGRFLLGAGGQLEEPVPVVRNRRQNLVDRQLAAGDGPCLVEGPSLSGGQLLQDTPGLNDNPVPGGPAHSGDHGHRGRQDQGTWGSHHEDLGKPPRVLGDPPGDQ